MYAIMNASVGARTYFIFQSSTPYNPRTILARSARRDLPMFITYGFQKSRVHDWKANTQSNVYPGQYELDMETAYYFQRRGERTSTDWGVPFVELMALADCMSDPKEQLRDILAHGTDDEGCISLVIGGVRISQHPFSTA